jgi:hypothetical protein
MLLINAIINPNPRLSHCDTWQYVYIVLPDKFVFPKWFLLLMFSKRHFSYPLTEPHAPAILSPRFNHSDNVTWIWKQHRGMRNNRKVTAVISMWEFGRQGVQLSSLTMVFPRGLLVTLHAISWLSSNVSYLTSTFPPSLHSTLPGSSEYLLENIFKISRERNAKLWLVPFLI